MTAGKGFFKLALSIMSCYKSITKKICITNGCHSYRSQNLQTAKTAYGNYRSEYDSLNSWLTRVPNYEPRETDDIRQIETKLANQRVSAVLMSNFTIKSMQTAKWIKKL